MLIYVLLNHNLYHYIYNVCVIITLSHFTLYLSHRKSKLIKYKIKYFLKIENKNYVKYKKRCL